MDMVAQQKLDALKNVVANTPLAKINLKYKGKETCVYAKLEYFNFSGSIKDRMAYYILRNAYEKGDIKPGDEISEATSGNTGIAFSAQGAFLGHKVNIFMPEWMSIERINLIKSLGANIILVSHEQGGFTGSVAMAKQYAVDHNGFMPGQFENEANVMAHYTTTGPEIWNQMAKFGVVPDAFTAGVGTGGTMMGTGRYLKSQNPDIKLYPMEPASCSTLLNGMVGPHRIQGIGDEFIPDIVKLNELDDIIEIDDGDAIIMAQKIAKVLGMGVGISSGANLLSALYVQEKFGKQNVVTVFADDNKKYLSTDYSKVEPVKEGFISSDVELISFEAVR